MGVEEISVHARLTVVPGKPSPPGKVHKLSYLDHIMQKHYLRIVFYYDTSSSSMDRSNLLIALKEYLCRALSVYPIFSSRLQKREDGLWEAKFNDAGVRVYEATCHLSMQEFFQKCLHSPLEAELSRHEINSDHTITPVAVVQFTTFSCGNLAIGLSWHHSIGDQMCGTLFMKAWGETYRASQVLHPPFFHSPSLAPRSQQPPNSEVRSRGYYTAAFFDQDKGGSENPTDYQSVTLCFSHDVVEKLISQVQNGSCKYGPPTPSEALAAFLWAAICKAQGKSESDEAKASLCLEIRKTHLPPLPFGYVGNAIHFVQLSCSVRLLTGDDLSRVASMVNENVGMVDTEEILSVVDLIQEYEDQNKGVLRNPPYFYSDGITISIFDQFFCNDVIFDFGKPVRVVYSVKPVRGEGHLTILPSVEGDSSRNVVVVLPKIVMEKLLKHAELVMLVPDLQVCDE